MSSLRSAITHLMAPITGSSSSRTILIPSLLLVLFAVSFAPQPAAGHGRLIEPPSRASAWRYGFQTPPNYNDHELYCGGFQKQQRNGGRCGECGDDWSAAQPRPHEYGGKWGQGVVVRRYRVGGEIVLRVELTASHMGYFEFRVCPELAAKQECLDRHLLELMGGTPSLSQPGDLRTRFYPRNGSRIYEIKGQLPEGLECANCVLQWRYYAGNNWGMCEDGVTGAVGCGAQEEFRACADINIGDVGPLPPLRPIRPGTGKTTTTTTPAPDADGTATLPDGPRYLGPIIAVICLLAVVCFLCAIYLYSYHGQRVKQLLHWKKATSKTGASEGVSSSLPPPPTQEAPVAPPRAKRLSQSLGDIEANESSVLKGTNLI